MSKSFTFVCKTPKKEITTAKEKITKTATELKSIEQWMESLIKEKTDRG